MKIVIDMDLSPNWASFLQSSGFEAVHWSEVGVFPAPDIEIMKYAAEFGFCVLTNDLDFGSILAVTHGEKPSVVQIRSDDLSTRGIGAMVASSLRQ